MALELWRNVPPSLGCYDPLSNIFLFCRARDQTQGLHHAGQVLSCTPGPATSANQTVWTNNSPAAAKRMHPPAIHRSTVCAKKRVDRISIAEQFLQTLGLVFTCLYERSPGYVRGCICYFALCCDEAGKSTFTGEGLIWVWGDTVHRSGEGKAVGIGDQGSHRIQSGGWQRWVVVSKLPPFFPFHHPNCTVYFHVHSTEARVILEEGSSIEKMSPQIGVWASLWCTFLTDD